MIKPEVSTRPEAAFVLLLLQSVLWAITGISAFPFVLAGEPAMAGLGLASLLLALVTVLAALGVLWRRRGWRRLVLVLEVLCLVGAGLQLVLPIGANHGLVSMMVNVGLPFAIFVIVSGSRDLNR